MVQPYPVLLKYIFLALCNTIFGVLRHLGGFGRNEQILVSAPASRKLDSQFESLMSTLGDS